MTRLLLALLPMLCWAQPAALRILKVTATQAVISYVPPNGSACTFELSESPSYSPVVNDVNNSLFAGSNSDAGRTVTGTTRTIILGTRTAAVGSDGKMYSRALRSATLHYLRLTCGSAATATFFTAQIEGNAPDVLPFNSSAFGNVGVPAFDYTSSNRGVPVIDPQTGASIYMLTNPRDASSAAEYSFPSGIFFQGGGWTNPGNITAASTGTTASTGTANAPLFIPIDGFSAFICGGFSYRPDCNFQYNGTLVDLALHVYGFASSATSGDRDFDVALSVDSGQTNYTSATTVNLPQTTPTNVGIRPTSFPTVGVANATWAPFIGFGGKIIPRDYIARGTITCTAGSCVEASSFADIVSGVFNPLWAAGSKVFVAGSSPTCASSYCTLAVPPADPAHLTFSESLTITGAEFRFAGLGFRIVKKTGTGTINLSASYELAKSFPVNAGPGDGCSPKQVTTNVDRFGTPITPGIVGRLCIFDWFYNLGGDQGNPVGASLYFVSEPATAGTSVEARLLSLGTFPFPPGGYTSSEWPYVPHHGWIFQDSTIFDPLDGNTFYTQVNGSDMPPTPNLFKAVYSGNYAENAALFFALDKNADLLSGPIADGITWTNLTRASLGHDLRTQILANVPAYTEALNGPLTGGLALVGISNGIATFQHFLASQDSGAWIFYFNASTGDYLRSYNTVTGSGAIGDMFGGVHSMTTTAGKQQTINNGLVFYDMANSIPYGGAFTVAPSHIYRSGSPSTNTALPASFDGTYDAACPGGLAQIYIDMGATGNNCVHFRFPTQPCSDHPTAAEKAATPCPGDATKSYIGVNVAAGNEFFDQANLADSEHFVFVTAPVSVSGNIFDIWAVRNAGNGYCCNAAVSGAGRCTGVGSQYVHLTTWLAVFVSRGMCGSVLQVTDPASPSSARSEFQMFVRGHNLSTPASTVGNMNYVGISFGAFFQPMYSVRYNQPLSSVGGYSNFTMSTSAPLFNAVGLDTSVTQSYVTPMIGAPYAIDWRHINPGIGTFPGAPGQAVGPTLGFSLVPGQAHTYKVTGFTPPNSKVQPFTIWTGPWSFQDMSSGSKGDLIGDIAPFKSCLTRHLSECRTGASIGDLYVSAPGLDTASTVCNTSQLADTSLCVFPAGPLQSRLAQLQIDKSDVSGAQQRQLGMSLTGPASQYTYTHARPFASTQPYKLLSTAFNQQGLWNGAVLVDPGPWNQTSQSATDYRWVLVQVSALAGANQARVRFGVADAGTPGTDFFCVPWRGEDCLTDAAAAPFVFTGDVLTPTSCSSGCTILVPTTPGRVTFGRIEWLNSGTVVSTGPLSFF